jgi:hypothetical protein
LETSPARDVIGRTKRPLRVLLRLLAAVPGGWWLSANIVALLGAAMAAAGLARSEAVVLAAMLGFVMLLLWLLWAFAVRSLGRLLAVTLGGLGLTAVLLHVLPMAGG